MQEENVQQEIKKKRGSPLFIKNGPSPNPNGRPKIAKPTARTNREIRSDELMKLLRKFAPHQTKAVQTALGVMERDSAKDVDRLKASALILQTYRQLLLDVFDHRYDTEENTEIQEDNRPVFSLRVLGSDTEQTGT
jgi:hypothetical protein